MAMEDLTTAYWAWANQTQKDTNEEYLKDELSENPLSAMY